MFKLNRMEEIFKTQTGFVPRQAPMPDLEIQKIYPGKIKVKALFQGEVKWRIVEEFGRNCFTEREDGTLLFAADYSDKENLVAWLLTFGDKVKVLEPADVKDELLQIAENVVERYKELS